MTTALCSLSILTEGSRSFQGRFRCNSRYWRSPRTCCSDASVCVDILHQRPAVSQRGSPCPHHCNHPPHFVHRTCSSLEEEAVASARETSATLSCSPTWSSRGWWLARTRDRCPVLVSKVFFYRPKSIEISDIFVLSVGSDKIRYRPNFSDFSLSHTYGSNSALPQSHTYNVLFLFLSVSKWCLIAYE